MTETPTTRDLSQEPASLEDIRAVGEAVGAMGKRIEARFAEQAQAIADLQGTVSAQRDRLTELRRTAEAAQQEAATATYCANRARETITELQRQLTAAGIRPQRAPDLNDRIVTFLDEHQGLRFTPTSIAENIGSDHKRIAERCTSLSVQGRIVRLAKAGRNPLYTSARS
jgi:chromosome segregation ATPase